ncbi:MAG: tryptophan-rich sensory protein [Proteobacteria bacterium]|nr:tryptophan-rich sensory protein [Pseudomonadota bacterium]
MSSKFSVFIYVFIALIVGGLASSNAANDIWYQELNKSSLNPPGFVFGIVWPILYLLMSISAFRTFANTKNLFLIQLIFNALWSWLFFAFQMPLIALLDIWLLIYLNIKLSIQMYKQDTLSGYLLFPYVGWLIFASYLNLYIVLNN